jgi:hypothetical protein
MPLTDCDTKALASAPINTETYYLSNRTNSEYLTSPESKGQNDTTKYMFSPQPSINDNTKQTNYTKLPPVHNTMPNSAPTCHLHIPNEQLPAPTGASAGNVLAVEPGLNHHIELNTTTDRDLVKRFAVCLHCHYHHKCLYFHR